MTTKFAARPHVAYVVTDTARLDEHSCVVFARSLAEARRHGASDLDGAVQDIVARRERRYDRYAAAGMRGADYLAEGWAWTCAGCDHRVSGDGCDRCADREHCAACADAREGRCRCGDIETPDPHITADGAVYCTPECAEGSR